MSIVQILPLITGPLTAVAFIGWLIARLFGHRKEKSLVESLRGAGIVQPGEVVKILEQFTSDEAKIKALRELLKYDNATAAKILEKAKSVTEVGRISLQQLKIAQWSFLGICLLLLLLTVVGLVAYAGGGTPLIPPSLKKVAVGPTDGKWNATITYDDRQTAPELTLSAEFADDETFQGVWATRELPRFKDDYTVGIELRSTNKVCVRLVLYDSTGRPVWRSKPLCTAPSKSLVPT